MRFVILIQTFLLLLNTHTLQERDAQASFFCFLSILFRVIGQKELVKTAVVIEISMAAAVISFFKEDTGWTKRVGKNARNP